MVKTPGDHLDSEWAVVAAEAKNVVALRLLKDHEILVPHGRHDRTKVVLLGEVVLALGFQVILGEAVRALVLGLHVIHGAILNLKFQAVQVEEVVQVMIQDLHCLDDQNLAMPDCQVTYRHGPEVHRDQLHGLFPTFLPIYLMGLVF